MKYAAGTDRGLLRDINEDSYMIIPGCSDTSCAFVIADGLGGHNSGEIASRMAVEYIRDNLDAAGCFDGENASEKLEALVKKVNTAVYERSLGGAEVSGMGTTLTMAVITGSTLTAAHVGDSRLYLIRNGVIRQLTDDHSYIGELVRQGKLTREEAEKHPRKNIITRAIGSCPELEVDIISHRIEADDIYVLCTDGLTNMVSESEIVEIVSGSEPETACARLIEAANRQGGEDNITVIVIKC
ncbi:MAG: Stp1/IreP family PP2C-type Ser/Thr phosphatase [Clostridiaceae bacterium]|nr:Stp1/IreP family PP2C-type Ser/Thr phosphatase [Clostridiaceae bacterium]